MKLTIEVDEEIIEKTMVDIMKRDLECNKEWLKTDEGQVLHRALLLLIGYYSDPVEYKLFCKEHNYKPILIMSHHISGSIGRWNSWCVDS